MTVDIANSRHLDHGRLPSPPPATETTPLLDSERPSDGQSDESLGWMRTTCIVLGMWILIFLQASNMSGMSTTQSAIAADLEAYDNAMWFTSSYLISQASVAPLLGRLAMIFSPGAMILFTSFFFSVGAVVTSQAQSFRPFIVGRVLSGIGGGGVMTLAMILVIQLASKRRRGLIIGLTNACFTFGVTLGAIVYGALLPVIGWVRPPSPPPPFQTNPPQRAIFWIQTPLGVLGGVTVYLSIPPSIAHQTPKDQEKTTTQKLLEVDYLGALTLSLTITALLLSLSTPHPSLALAFLLLLPLFLVLQSRHPTPILPVPTLLHPPTLLSCLSQLLFMASRWTLLFYGPVFALAVRGLSPAAAGSVLLPTNVGFALGGVGAGVVMHRRPRGVYWGECILCLTWFGASFMVLSWACRGKSTGWFLAGAFANGVGTGAALNYTLGHVLGRAAEGEGFLVTGLLSTFRGFAGSFGAAGGGGLFGRLLRRGVLVGSPAKVWEEGVLSEEERGVAVRAYGDALTKLFAVVAGVVVVVVVLQAGTGWKGRGEEEEDG
ncbi:major facilitator superfamily domain-containing protein [Schizothecium vesticola]|uniref:Major facilitator superfamily domain-containing protein n=1 Tax=Schizothecium vesticola TaxID=314040 RepID=A0AA40F6X1_9PEZI|nr:major facilitator superfamily domain-containing protein [Schizothecium vesticola]